ncbi:hypothetical protein ACHAWU_005974 [Discostella pseudostelligera]|uniref:Uncharacterized protein n=1 Tax=Discostella pseudostelligera TaxID=259834 RepID=A0ABD3MCS8_9STRA
MRASQIPIDKVAVERAEDIWKFGLSNQSEPEASSYLTVDGYVSKSPLIDRDSHSACCISMRVYAFEPAPPFNIVVRSGYFCLGFYLKLQHQQQHHGFALKQQDPAEWLARIGCGTSLRNSSKSLTRNGSTGISLFTTRPEDI